MADLIIRKFEQKDQHEVSMLYQSGMDAYSHIPIIRDCTKWFVSEKSKPGGDMSDIQKNFMQQNKSCFWVAELHGSIVGIVGALPSDKHDTYVELLRMSVSSACRKMGVGSRLIKVLDEWAKEQGFTHIYLTTLEKMNLAVELYVKNGFELVELEPADLPGKYNMQEESSVVNVCHFVKPIA